jgi:hypothetical protein
MLPAVAFYHKSRRLKPGIRTIWFGLPAGLYFIIELDEYVTIRPLFLRACTHAWFRGFSIFDAAFEYRFDSLSHSSKTSLFMFARELLEYPRERIDAPTCRATIEYQNQLHRGEKN